MLEACSKREKDTPRNFTPPPTFKQNPCNVFSNEIKIEIQIFDNKEYYLHCSIAVFYNLV